MSNKVLITLLVSTVVLVYLPVFVASGLEFVFDDIRFVEDNDAVHDLGRTIAYFTDLSTVDPHGWGGIYRPLRTLDFAIDWAIATPFESVGKIRWLHFRSLLYHVAAVLLAFALFRRWGATEGAATLGALVFALHPVNVESVAWITSRADVMFLALFLWALLLHGKSEGADRNFFLAAFVLALALLSKESAIVFVGCAVLTDFFFRDGRRLSSTLRRWPKYLVYAALGAGYYILWATLHNAADEPLWHLPVRWGGSLWGTILMMSRGFVYYLRLVFFPVDMAQDWYLAEVPSLDAATAACLLGVVSLVAWALVRAFRGGGVASFATLWFLIAIFPVSNLWAPIGIPTAERFLYLPLVGVSLALGVLLARVWAVSGAGGRAARAGIVLVLLCMAAVSVERSFIWTTSKRLWLSSVTRFESPRSHDWRAKRDRILGENLQRERRRLVDEDRMEEAKTAGERAEAHFEKALAGYDREIEIWYDVLPDPTGPVAQTRALRSLCLSGMQRYQEALEEADRVLRDWADHFQGYASKAVALYGLGRFREAAVCIEASLEQRDHVSNRENAAAIYEKLGMLYEQEGNRAQAYLALRKAWDHLPDAKRNPAVSQALEQMEEEYSGRAGPLGEAVDDNPRDWNSWLELATLYAAYGYYDKSAQIFHELLKSERPQDGDVFILLPYALYQWQWRDTEEGYREAIRIYDIILGQQPEHEAARRERQRCEERLRRLRNQ
ncbi:MAG: tetratricopeptide repeat protein [Planctomycetota bacterium]